MSHTQRRLTHATFFPPAFTVVARRVVTTHDVVMEAMTCRMRWIRPGVRLGATSVEADKSDGGLGVKAPRMKTSRGSFLGVYRASMWRQTTERPYTGANTCVMQVGSWRAMSLPKKGRMPFHQYPMMAVQEPPAGKIANCQFVPFYKAGDINAPGLVSGNRNPFSLLTPIFRCSQSQKRPSSLRCLIRCAGSRASRGALRSLRRRKSKGLRGR